MLPTLENTNVDSQKLDKIKSNGKELKRIDWDIVKRILELLYHEGQSKKTNIAMKCNLNHEQVTTYLDWIDMFDFIKKESENKVKWIALSERGREFYSRKIASIKNYHTEELRNQMRNLLA
jgi:predicted transcriptional regulator